MVRLSPVLIAVSLAIPALSIAQEAKPSAETTNTGVSAEAKNVFLQPVDPERDLFGLAWGATTEEIHAKLGKPIGYLQLGEKRSLLIYPSEVRLLLFESKLDGVLLGRGAGFSIEYPLSGWLEGELYGGAAWQLTNGLRNRLSLKEAKALLPLKMLESRYRAELAVPGVRATVRFSHQNDLGESDDAYDAYAVELIRLKADGRDNWSQPPQPTQKSQLQGKKMLGLTMGDSAKGIRVIGVYGNSPADQAELKPGDLITEFNGESALGKTANDFQAATAQAKPVELTVVSRSGASRRLTLTPADGGTFGGLEMSHGPSEVVVGQEAPDFEATQGEQKVRLSSLRGGPVVINFTASWCGPCKMETPELVQVEAQFRAQGVKFLSVYLDNAQVDVPAYAAKLGVTWPLNFDGRGWQNQAARAYGIVGVPTNVVVDAEGKIASVSSRGQEALSQLLTQLLKK